MPVVLEQGASGRSFNLLEGVRCVPAFSALEDGAVEIGIVNNMPDAALELTERQFVSLLAAASGKTEVRVRLYALPQIPRGDFTRRRLLSDYADIGRLWNTRLDALIVTGMEPRAGALTDEPYWPILTELIDWAESAHHLFDLVLPRRPCGGASPRRHRASPAAHKMLRRLRMHEGIRPPADGRGAGPAAGSTFALE